MTEADRSEHEGKSALAMPSLVANGLAGLCERDQEVVRLIEAISAATAGVGNIVVVQGPAGIGKTSLVEFARRDASERGVRLLTARCTDLESRVAFGVIRQLIDPLLVSSVDREQLLVGPAVRTAALFDGAPAPSGDESFAFFHGLYWLFADLCTRGPVAFAIDDLQWCDWPSLRFLTYLAPRIPELPLVVIAALRTGEQDVGDGLHEQLRAADQVSVMRPRPLSEEGCTDLVRSWVSPVADDGFCSAFWRATGGNPLLIRELATTMNESGLAPDAANSVRLSHLASDAIVERVGLQLDRLGKNATRMAHAVAVLSNPELRIAVAVSGLDDGAGVSAIEALVGAHLLELDGASVRFLHPLVRAAVYDGMPSSARGGLHFGAAHHELKRGLGAERIAAHLLLTPAALDASMIDVLSVAASNAASRGSPEVAVRYLERALVDAHEASSRGRLLMQLGPLCAHIDVAKSIPLLREGLTLAGNASDYAATSDTLIRTLFFWWLARGSSCDRQRGS